MSSMCPQPGKTPTPFRFTRTGTPNRSRTTAPSAYSNSATRRKQRSGPFITHSPRLAHLRKKLKTHSCAGADIAAAQHHGSSHPSAVNRIGDGLDSQQPREQAGLSKGNGCGQSRDRNILGPFAWHLSITRKRWIQ